MTNSEKPVADALTPVKRALLALEKMQAKLDLVERERTEPIAIIGMGCRFPGGAADPEAFWTMLRNGVDAIGSAARRWGASEVARLHAAGLSGACWGGFLDDVEQFDPAFFGISGKEAAGMDPQQRLLLEVAWEALERAGRPPASLSGSQTGVFIGICSSDYALNHLAARDGIDAYASTGTAYSLVANRLSYMLNLQGPSMAIDTACSSSLVAAHLACQSLRGGECSLALAGGVNLTLLLEGSVSLAKWGMLASDGRCKTFDARADGYVRGEGCGVLVLKRLSDALAAGDPILALIRGSAVNQDGRSAGLTAPNLLAQQAVIRQALRNARITPDRISYVEAHGTGTPLGDPIEVEALSAVMGEARPDGSKCLIGSVKANIGHLEAAAGMAGLIKVVLAMQHGEIPPHLHFKELNPNISLGSTPFVIPSGVTPWTAAGQPRCAGISSFGFGGTNGHVILEEAPAPAAAKASALERPLHVLAISAKSAAALDTLTDRYQQILSRPDAPALADVCFSANTGRNHFSHRTAIAGSKRFAGIAEATARLKVGFLFTGQGAQHAGMGRELYDTQPAFRAALDRCAAIADPLLDQPLLHLMFDEAAPLHLTRYTQPALFALEYALAVLWRDWGVEPAIVLGHSLGELTAACIAGVFSLEDGLRLAVARGRLMQDTPPGAMAAIFLDEDGVRAALGSIPGTVTVAALNGPSETVVSGEEPAVAALVEHFRAKGVRVKPIFGQIAFHSPLMAGAQARFAAEAAKVAYAPPQLGLVCNLTGRLAGPGEISQADYWVRQIAQPVQFHTGLETLCGQGIDVLVEIGPKPVLLGILRKAQPDSKVAGLPSLRPGAGEWDQMLDSLARYYVAGGQVDWAAFDRDYSRRRVMLPTYPFQRARYWLDRAAVPDKEPTVPPDWLYELKWEQVTPQTTGNSPAGVIVVADGGTGGVVAGHLMALLANQGTPAISAAAGEPLETRADWDVVDLRALDSENGPEAVATNCRRALETAQAVVTRARLWLITRGAQAVIAGDAANLALSAAPLWGLGRVLANEHPAHWGGLVDLDPAATPVQAAEELQKIFTANSREKQWAFRNGQTYGLRVAPKQAAAAKQLAVDADASYLITGGLGALGLSFAAGLAASGAKKLVLIGRKLPTPEQQARIDALGCAVETMQADVSQADDVARVLDAIRAGGKPLRGIVHCAGVLDDGILLRQTWPRWEAVLAPKVLGGWNLHVQTAGDTLDFFVLCGSASGVMGGPGQSNYAAANVYLDALATFRRGQGLPAVSLDWGPWAEYGMSAGRKIHAGIGAIPVATGVAAFLQLAAGDAAQVMILPVQAAYPTAQTATGASGRSEILRRLDKAPAAKRNDILIEFLRKEVATVLGLDPAYAVETQQGFLDIGMDSLMAVDLRNRLIAALDLSSLPVTIVFDHPNIASLAGYLEREIFSSAAPTPAAAVATADSQAIAIVGLGCRFPGSVESPEEFWKVLRDGVDCIVEIPRERWNIDEYYDPDPDAAGKTYSRHGGFIRHVDQFDPRFFRISPREAVSMDPQQRLLLEVSWEALEHGGQPADRLAGSRTGVFVGIGSSDYSQVHMQSADASDIDVYFGTGNTNSAAAGRLSYVFGFEGPSMAIDTACSSSLVAIHLACQSLRNGECTLALAGGVQVMLSPGTSIFLSRARALAADGACKAFDASADGYVRGEGCGMVVLKKMSDALADGDDILAVIAGSAVNQDGRSAGFTAPNGSSQEAVIAQALAAAGIAPEDVSYVEAHGTGTPLGDPIEVRALAAALGAGRLPGQPLSIGSVKSNLGHLEAAAGVAGLIKTVLALRHREIPPSLHCKHPNQHIPWDAIPVTVATQLTPWQPVNGRRIAGISSFGISGTNAHAVLMEAPAKAEASAPAERTLLLPLSARSPAALRSMAAQYMDWIDTAAAAPRDICYTASVRRTHHNHRLGIVAESAAGFSKQLRAWLDGEQSSPASDRRGKIAFVYSGQGSQSVGMGRGLLAQEPVFRRTVEMCDRALANEVDWSLLDVLTNPDSASRLNDIDVIQPALFAMQTGLTALWHSWGIVPDAVIGHSMGEVAAAHAAGVLSLEDAVRIIARRSKLLRGLRGSGAMAQVELGMEAAQAAVAGHASRVAVAVSNSSRATVLSGDPGALDEVLSNLEQRGVYARRIKVDVASHSPQVDPLRAELLKVLEGIHPRHAEIPIYSTVEAALADGSTFDASYWVRNLREPVRFAATVERLALDEHTLFVEISPHPILLPAVADILRDLAIAGTALPSLRRAEDERASMLQTLAALYTRGAQPAWSALYPDGGTHTVLPRYPWDRQRCWLEPRPAALRARQATLKWPGQKLRSPALAGTVYETAFGAQVLPWLEDHRIGTSLVAAGAAHLALAASAAGASVAMEDIEFAQALVLEDRETRTIQLALTPAEDGKRTFRIYSDAESTWPLHASGVLCETAAADATAADDLASIRTRCHQAIASSEFYRQLWDSGYRLGRTFRWIDEIWRGDGEVICHMRAPEAADHADSYRIHPGLLDSCFQATGVALRAEDAAHLVDEDVITVPVGIDKLHFEGSLSGNLWCHAIARSAKEPHPDEVALDVHVFDEAGRIVLTIERFRARRVARASLGGAPRDGNWLYRLEWRADSGAPDSVPVAASGQWLILDDSAATGQTIAASLEARGEKCLLIASTELDSQILKSPCRGVIHCAALNATEPAADDPACIGALTLVQSLAQGGWRNPPRLFLITRGAQAVVPGEPISVAQTPLWGLGRTIAIEHPDLNCTRIDIGAGDFDLRHLINEILLNSREDQVALRASKRYVLRLTGASVAARPRESSFKADATYLITGGLGGVGLSVARWMLGQGARNLVLAGRSAAENPFPSVDANVTVMAADVTQADQLARVIQHIDRSMPPLRGVIHAATVLDDGILLQLNPERFRTAMAPKVTGAWNLHKLTLGHELDFFVLFSSLASFLGSPGQGNYAAGNAFLDGLAHYRRARGLPGLSINWGPWSDVGQAAARSNRGERLATRGVASIKPELGLRVFDLLLQSELPQAGVMSFNLRQWREFYPAAAQAPLLAVLREQQGPVEDGRPVGQMRKLLEACRPEARRAMLLAHLQDQFGQVMRIGGTQIDPSLPLGDLGLDSLMGLEIRNRLEASLGLTLSATMAWTYPTLSALTGHLADRLGLTLEDPVAPVEAAPDGLASVASAIAHLSDEEMEALLMRKLQG